MTLKIGGLRVKEASHSSTARPQEIRRDESSIQRIRSRGAAPPHQTFMVRGRSCAVSNHGYQRGLMPTRLVPARYLAHGGELLGAGGALKLRSPGVVGHAVNGLAALVPGERDAFGVGLLFHPVRQA